MTRNVCEQYLKSKSSTYPIIIGTTLFLKKICHLQGNPMRTDDYLCVCVFFFTFLTWILKLGKPKRRVCLLCLIRGSIKVVTDGTKDCTMFMKFYTPDGDNNICVNSWFFQLATRFHCMMLLRYVCEIMTFM